MTELKSFLRNFVVESSRLDSEQEVSDNKAIHQKIFPDKRGLFWDVVRYLFYGLSFLAHTSLAVSFISFFVTALSFSVNSALEIVLEMISPASDSFHRRNFYAACLFVILLCVIVISSLVLSLFWEIVVVILYKSAMRYTNIKIALFVVDIVTAGIWSGVTESAQTGFILFLSKCLIVSWVMAFVLSLLGSLFLLVFVYTEDLGPKPIFPVNVLTEQMIIVIFLIVLLMFSILSPIAFKLVNASSGGIAFAFLLPFCTLMLCMYLVRRGRREEGHPHRFVIQKKIFLLVCTVFLVITIAGANINMTCGKECELGPPSKNNYIYGYKSLIKDQPKVSGYPICDKLWSSRRLDITDMAFLAGTAYKIKSDNKTVIANIIDDYFMDRNIQWTVEAVNNKKPFFFHIRDPSSNVNVFSIRGTVDARDWYENAKMWNEIAVFQMISVVLPIQHLPFEFVAFFIAKSASLDYLLHQSSYGNYFKPLEDYIQAENKSSEECYLVGHSLGGGLAKIIGSRNKIPAIAISSPGEIYNHVKFDYTLEDVQTYTTTVRAQNDPVTWIDRSGGLVQYVECDNSDFLKCHSISNTYCELKKKCHTTTRIHCPGDPKTWDVVMDRLYKKPYIGMSRGRS